MAISEIVGCMEISKLNLVGAYNQAIEDEKE